MPPTEPAPWVDRGHLRDGVVYCADPACRVCDDAIALRERNFPPATELPTVPLGPE